jgi:hypothetical protein
MIADDLLAKWCQSWGVFFWRRLARLLRTEPIDCGYFLRQAGDQLIDWLAGVAGVLVMPVTIAIYASRR